MRAETLVFSVDPLDPDPRALEEARKALEQGEVVGYPTETLYGLGVDPFRAEALQRLYRLKGRPSHVPVSVLVRDREMIEPLVTRLSPLAERLMQAYLPGPLTLVLPARPGLPYELTGGLDKIGIRISSYPLMPHLFSVHPFPLTTTSANPAGLPGARDGRMVLLYFPTGLEVVLDGGVVQGGVGSTVVDLSGPKPVVLREGAIPEAELSGFFGAPE